MLIVYPESLTFSRLKRKVSSFFSISSLTKLLVSRTSGGNKIMTACKLKVLLTSSCTFFSEEKNCYEMIGSKTRKKNSYTLVLSEILYFKF